MPLIDALRKMTLMPAQRLEKRVPAMRDRGRLRTGADADITVFDPITVRDASTYTQAALQPLGMRYSAKGASKPRSSSAGSVIAADPTRRWKSRDT